MQKFRNLRLVFGMSALLISFIFILFYSNLVFVLIEIVTNYLSHDNYIKDGTVFSIKILSVFIISFLLVIGFFTIPQTNQKFVQLIDSYFHTNKLNEILFVDKLCSKKQLSKSILVLTTMFGFLIHFYLLLVGKPSFEGALEKYSSTLFFFSAIILIISTTQIYRIKLQPNTKKQIIFSLMTIAAVLLLIFGEEISWGQRIFGWESFGVFKEHNIQKETNLHNFFNPLFTFAYPIVGMTSFLVLLFIWLFFKRGNNYFLSLLLPHPSLFFLAFLMACSSFPGHSEVFEELLAIFAFFYSFRVLMCLRFPSKKVLAGNL